MPLFEWGQVVATRTALLVCQEHNISTAAMIARHAKGEWGDLGGEDMKANQDAVALRSLITTSLNNSPFALCFNALCSRLSEVLVLSRTITPSIWKIMW